MNDERGDKPVKPTLLERLSAFLTREPEDPTSSSSSCTARSSTSSSMRMRCR
jgi:hypothetical protein